MKRLLGIAFLCVIALSQVQCKPASANAETNPANTPRRVGLSAVFTQSYDSLGAIVTWTAPPAGGVRRFPLAGYNVRIVRDLVGDTLVGSYIAAPLTIDTLWLAMPALGDTLVFYAAVSSVDTVGQESETWALSNSLTWVTTSLLPFAPESVAVDTAIGSLIIDSLQIIARDGVFGVSAPGDTTRLAAILYSGSLAVECCCQAVTDPPGTHPCDNVELVDLGFLLPQGQDVIPYVRAESIRGATDFPLIADKGVIVRSNSMRRRRRAHAFLYRVEVLLVGSE